MIKQDRNGFTLIELLIVIGIIAILAAVVIVAVNPSRQFGQANNTQRESNVNAILSAIGQYQIENGGNLPSSITTTETEICETGASSCTGLIDLSVLTNSGTYLNEIPVDPSCPDDCVTNGVGYTVLEESNGRVTVSAPDAELGKTILMTR